MYSDTFKRNCNRALMTFLEQLVLQNVFVLFDDVVYLDVNSDDVELDDSFNHAQD